MWCVHTECGGAWINSPCDQQLLRRDPASPLDSSNRLRVCLCRSHWVPRDHSQQHPPGRTAFLTCRGYKAQPSFSLLCASETWWTSDPAMTPTLDPGLLFHGCWRLHPRGSPFPDSSLTYSELTSFSFSCSIKMNWKSKYHL